MLHICETTFRGGIFGKFVFVLYGMGCALLCTHKHTIFTLALSGPVRSGRRAHVKQIPHLCSANTDRNVRSNTESQTNGDDSDDTQMNCNVMKFDFKLRLIWSLWDGDKARQNVQSSDVVCGEWSINVKTEIVYTCSMIIENVSHLHLNLKICI